MVKTHCIIGLSAAGIGAINRLLRLSQTDRIIGISEQSCPPYNTCFLADYYKGEIAADQLSIFDQEKYADRVTLIFNNAVTQIQPDEQLVVLSCGMRIAYDTLFVATGVAARLPQVPLQPGVFTFHTLQDCRNVMQFSNQKNVTRAVVVGSGLTGIETADALHTGGLSVSIVERDSRILSSVVSEQESKYIARRAHHHGVSIVCNDEISEVVMSATGERPEGVFLVSGAFIPADMVVYAIGAEQRCQLACTAGIVVSDKGIVTDEYMRTNIKNIFAGGDVARVTCQFSGDDIQSCTWSDAMLQGITAAYGMVGQEKKYPGAMRSLTSFFFGIAFEAGGVPVCQYSTASLSRISNDHELGTYAMCEGKVNGYIVCSTDIVSRVHKKYLLSRQVV